jgi:hypothetical protein
MPPSLLFVLRVADAGPALLFDRPGQRPAGSLSLDLAIRQIKLYLYFAIRQLKSLLDG